MLKKVGFHTTWISNRLKKKKLVAGHQQSISITFLLFLEERFRNTFMVMQYKCLNSLLLFILLIRMIINWDKMWKSTKISPCQDNAFCHWSLSIMGTQQVPSIHFTKNYSSPKLNIHQNLCFFLLQTLTLTFALQSLLTCYLHFKYAQVSPTRM